MEVLRGKPVFNFSVYWMGSIFKQFSEDQHRSRTGGLQKRIVAPNINVKEISLMNESMFTAGCFLMLQTRTQDFMGMKAPL